MKAGYLDCFAGASGDMILGAMVDAGLSLEKLDRELKKIPVSGWDISAARVMRSSISATQVTVSVTPSRRKKKYRLLKEIKSIIEKSSLTSALKEKGIAVFQNLVQAEGKVHSVPPDEVKLYEVGAVDAIIDVMGAVVGFDLMGLEKVYSSPLPAGQGSIKTGHGYDYPVPAPATMELLARAKAPIVVSGDPWKGEMVTPTGAAIITTLASFDK
ncbi:MAG: LarC family nickel insertion protein, partial [Dehalococcoidia bacterium]|nr:LarC family nickel insertion protein [Dehalococcoidia bacterium]